MLYDDKMKVLFNLKSEQKNELLLNLIFPDYPDGNGGEGENCAKEKETENSVSFSGCSYTPVMVRIKGLAHCLAAPSELSAKTNVRTVLLIR